MCLIHRFVVIAVFVVGTTVSAFGLAAGQVSLVWGGAYFAGAAFGYLAGYGSAAKNLKAATIHAYAEFLRRTRKQAQATFKAEAAQRYLGEVMVRAFKEHE